MRSRVAVIGWLGLCAPWAALAAARPEAADGWIETFLVNWAPMLLLIGVWAVFMRRWQTRYTDRQREHMERVESQLERIATALERTHGPSR